MGKKIPKIQQDNASLRVKNDKQYKCDVRSFDFDDYEKDHPVFLFNDFKLNSICIPGEFNNHYKDVDSYLRILSTLFGRGLELLSNETVKELVENSVKQSTMLLLIS